MKRTKKPKDKKPIVQVNARVANHPDHTKGIENPPAPLLQILVIPTSANDQNYLDLIIPITKDIFTVDLVASLRAFADKVEAHYG